MITTEVRLPIKVEQGEAGLWYVTSPLIKGLLVAAHSEVAALRKVQSALTDMARAIELETSK